MTNQSVFARLDTSLMRSTKQDELQKPESQKTSIPVIQKAGKPENQKTRKRATFPKITYRICPEAFDAIEEVKRMLRKQYHIKANLEEIAELAILQAHKDLMENQASSSLVNQLSRKPENQKA